ncbi:hypothetical protein U0070_024173 [Myodes glareolus]|uniref:DNA topoisomerase 1 n=1 Tax=Myodes glareolus TaxID=447135 RepID=A0AAW0I8Q3_MYOGA
MGMLKRRIMSEDIIVNCSKDAKAPSPPPGHKWKEVRHDNKFPNQGQKYETAQRLKKCVDNIRNQCREDWKPKEMKVRQRAVALYFTEKVFKNLQLFMEKKQPEDGLFDRLNIGILNKHLQDLMEALTAKVFRMYIASITLQQQLKELAAPDENAPADS